MFAALAPLLAARPRMRVLNPRSNTSQRTRSLTLTRPAWPAAVPIYDPARLTTMLALDFDSKRHGAPAVERDVAKMTAWLRDCGGRWISDHNPGNGGRHVLVLLARGESYRRVNIEPVMRLLANRLPTLDISPMLNEKTGYITPPGSATKDGGSRLLDGPLAAAIDACASRSEPGVIARLRLLLGDSLQTSPAPAPTVLDTVPADLWEGTGTDARLRPEWQLRSEIPSIPTAFAVLGAMPSDGRYGSRTEGCQSVLVHAALRGMSLTDVQARVYSADADAWSGLRARYDNDGHRAAAHLRHDWSNACHWTSRHVQLLRYPGHREQVVRTPPGGTGTISARDTPYSRWLTSATSWVHASFPGTSYRWTVLTVFQALAYAAWLTKDRGGDGTPLVGVGIRSLALHAGLMPETTVADVLARIRDMPGAPIDRVRQAAGTLADLYSLVPAMRPDALDTAIEPTDLSRVWIEPVHDAWRVLGPHHRAVYELITRTGLRRRADLAAAARIPTSTADDTLAALKRAGLIVSTGRGIYGPGAVGLDDIATAHGLPAERARRLATYLRQRREWRTWLEIRHGAVPDPGPIEPADLTAPWDLDTELDEAIWTAQLATGPPDPLTAHSMPEDGDSGPERDDDAVALALLIAELGATPITSN
ncbi:hypothetical protein [Nocardia bovistercoris]|uniref:Uncharacterized protein n=1 Tax=Nocardia bovistercoris TaxID=2785916 RepID=A0A931N738_9NOCA|nr:hypothetical protein [Nocardia bovistercoris]MBH0780353.1 hypothetical protein [Nocardia bovistercoris]